eukprot:m.173578 g.173578  ORF g.173578 m.173578 type:complete len:420 (+) comp31732_c0_seq1:293-1552(+)
MSSNYYLRIATVAFVLGGVRTNGQAAISSIASDITINANDLFLTDVNSVGDPVSIKDRIESIPGLQLSAADNAKDVSQCQQDVSTLRTDVNKAQAGVNQVSDRVDSKIPLLNQSQIDLARKVNDQKIEIADLQTTVAALSELLNSTIANFTAIIDNITNPTITFTPFKSCRDVIQRNTSAASGVYSVTPVGFTDAFDVYCENEVYGGGWTLVEKTVSGSAWGGITADQFYEAAVNPIDDTGETGALLTRNIGGAPFVASLKRAKVNALARFSESAVVRIDFLQCETCAGNQGIYMQQKDSPPSDFDYWGAMRNAMLWGEGAEDANHIQGLGTSFFLAKNPSTFNPERNSFVHDTCGDTSYGYWSTNTRTVKGEDVTFTRHGGLIQDGHCAAGNLWGMTLEEDDARFMQDSSRRQVIYIR